MYEPLSGDERLRQLHFLSSGSRRDLTRIVEPSANEMRIVKARRQLQLHSSSGYPESHKQQKRFDEFALATTRDALETGLCVETELARHVEARFDEAYGPKWKCFVGLTAAFARSGVSLHPGHPHAHFSVGQLPVLVCKEPQHELLGARHEASDARSAGGSRLTTAQAQDPSLNGSLYASMKLHVC